MQKATLDPAKISGRCGRLKCCLRYEYDTYEEYRRDLPKVGVSVMTRVGQGKVIAQEILARKVLVRYEGARDVLTEERRHPDGHQVGTQAGRQLIRSAAETTAGRAKSARAAPIPIGIRPVSHCAGRSQIAIVEASGIFRGSSFVPV